MTRAFQFKEPYQAILFDKLRQLIGPGPAIMYRDACQLMQGDSGLGSISHLVSHLLREINGAVIDSMLPMDWKPSDPNHAYRCKIEHLLDMDEYLWSDRAGTRSRWEPLGDICDLVHRNSLGTPPDITRIEPIFKCAESVFRTATDALEAGFATVQWKLDELLRLPLPGANDVKMLKKNMPNSPIVLRRFFAAAGSEWLMPLVKGGFFQNPPRAIRDEVGTLLHHPVWPQSAYLKRMAATDKASIVCDIIKGLRCTDNGIVLDDFGEAMLAMPPQVAVELVDNAKEWLQSEEHFHLPSTLGKVCARLAEGGEPIYAVELARGLLADPIAPGLHSEARSHSPWGGFGGHHYREILEERLPTIAAYAGLSAVEMLCDVLDEVLRRLYSDHMADGDFDDGSQYWQHEIECNYDRYGENPKALLTTAVRRTAEELLSGNRATPTNLVEVLERRRWIVLRRIALHILRDAQVPAIELISARLADQFLFNDPNICEIGIAREYGLLLQRRYTDLPSHQKTQILNWIHQGPDIDRYRCHYESLHHKTPSKAKIKGHVERWQLQRLSLIKDHLPISWHKRYEAMRKRHAEAEAVAVSHSHSSHRSKPLTADMMKSMGAQDLVEQLGSWRPDGCFETYDDIARELMSAVSAEPERLSGMSDGFGGMRSLFVWALLYELRNAVRRGQSICWKPVLSLCKCILDGIGLVTEAIDDDFNCDWDKVHISIAELVRDGLNGGASAIPADMGPAVWRVIELLADSPAVPDDEPNYGQSSITKLHYALLNSPRAQGIWAAVDYGIWLKRSDASTASRDDVGLAAIPEIQQLLERHLDRHLEPSIVARSVYGLLLDRLLWLDKDWTARHVDEILPTEPQHYNQFSAAWKLHIFGESMQASELGLLTEKYIHAIKNMTIAEGERWHLENPSAELVKHVLLLYVDGRIPLDAETMLLTRIFATMPDEWRGHALSFLGETMSTQETTAETMTRLQRLWEWRYSVCMEEQLADSHQHELASFGSWWISRRFPDDWALRHLESVLNTIHWAEPDEEVVAGLARMSPTDPYRAIRLLDEMCKGLRIRRSYVYMPWTTHAREIIGAAHDSDDEEARRIASALVSRLIFWDYGGFNDLI